MVKPFGINYFVAVGGPGRRGDSKTSRRRRLGDHQKCRREKRWKWKQCAKHHKQKKQTKRLKLRNRKQILQLGSQSISDVKPSKIIKMEDGINSSTDGILLVLSQQASNLGEEFYKTATKTKRLTLVFTKPPTELALKYATASQQIQTPVGTKNKIAVVCDFYRSNLHPNTNRGIKHKDKPITHELTAWATAKELGRDSNQKPSLAYCKNQGRITKHTACCTPIILAL